MKVIAIPKAKNEFDDDMQIKSACNLAASFVYLYFRIHNLDQL